MKATSDRTAWTVLLSAFAVFCALAVGIPLGISTFINNASVQPQLMLQLQAGRLRWFAQNTNENRAEEVSNRGREIEEGATVIADNDGRTQGLLEVRDNGVLLARINLYSGARVNVQRARIPRFSSAAQSSVVVLYVQAGRVQVEHGNVREIDVRVNTANTESALRAGTMIVEVGGDVSQTETGVSMREGTASVRASNVRTAGALHENVLVLLSNQRVTRKGDEALQVAVPLRNLVRNSGFVDTLGEPNWSVVRRSESDSAPLGKLTQYEAGSDHWLEVVRTGNPARWGRTGVTQLINEDMKGRRALRARVVFSIVDQELPVCGGLGSECPMLLRVLYGTPDGGEREWVQGFYAKGTANDDLPDYVRNFAALERQRHIKTPFNTREQFESENLLEAIKEMQVVKSISVYAEGHAVNMKIYSVELLLQE